MALLALLLCASVAHAAGPECSPLTYGAVGDGVTDNAAAIQKAIDTCEATYGGGVVRLNAEPGKSTYVTSPIQLANHIKLQLDKGVTLLGTTDHSKYHLPLLNQPFHPNEALVWADKATDVGIIGAGIIDGQGGMPARDGGKSWWELTPRPWLVEFYQCTGVTVNDVTFTNAPMWNLVLRYSKYITVSELSVTATPDPPAAHTDGIDLIGSSDATLIFLNISSGGDSVALKSGNANQADVPQLPTHDIQIVNSRFSNGNGLVIGDEAANGIYNVMANNITATGTAYGLLVSSNRSRGSQAPGIYNIMAQNLTLTNTRQPFVISAYAPAMGGPVEPPYDPPQPITAFTPNIHDITILGLTATGAAAESLIVGLPESCIRNVRLGNVSITGRSAGLRLRNMMGAFTNVTSKLLPEDPPFTVQENVTLTTAGTTPAITNTPAPGSGPPCGRNPEN